MWLRDSLPGDLPGSCIMTWGYDASIPGSKDTQTISDIATKFREDLFQLSEGIKSKPFVFIAHSLGGLVLKRVSRPEIFLQIET
jgi:hypothetical protein